MTDSPALPLRILVAAAAALWAVLVPGQAGALMEQPLRLPLWLSPRPAPAPAIASLRPIDGV